MQVCILDEGDTIQYILELYAYNILCCKLSLEILYYTLL